MWCSPTRAGLLGFLQKVAGTFESREQNLGREGAVQTWAASARNRENSLIDSGASAFLLI